MYPHCGVQIHPMPKNNISSHHTVNLMCPNPGCSIKNSFPTAHCERASSKQSNANKFPSWVFLSAESCPSGACESRSAGCRAREKVVQGGSSIITQRRPASDSRIIQMKSDSSRKSRPFLISITGPHETFRFPHAWLIPPAPPQTSNTTKHSRSSPARGLPVHTRRKASLNPHP